MNLESKLDLLESVDRDIKNGSYKNLFKYLEYRMSIELENAQEFAKLGHDKEMLSTVLVTAVYKDIINWKSNKGSFRDDVIAVSEEIQSNKEK